MFNQPHSAQAAVPWQPNAGIAKKLSSRGYASTSWTSDAPETFADLGYPAQSSGFSAAHYQSMRQPLTQQAQASLALLEGESRNELFGEEKPTPHEGTESNAHLPFVMDAYGASRKSQLRVNVDPQVLKRALAQADLAETLVLSPITSDDQGAEPVVIHPDVVEPSEAMPEVAVSASEPEPEPEPVIPELPAVMGGIPPEEVAQREAEQFAKGLAQAQEEAAVQLVEAIEKAMAEGLSKGLEQGKTEGLAEGLAEGLQMGLEQGKAQGLAEGEQTARDAVAEEMAAQRVIFENVSSELGALIADPKKFFEPLKRLALHLAESWRDRLLEDDTAVQAWMNEHPSTDSQQLRALVRQGRKDDIITKVDIAKGLLPRQSRSYREIFQLVKEHLNQADDDLHTPEEDAEDYKP